MLFAMFSGDCTGVGVSGRLTDGLGESGKAGLRHRAGAQARAPLDSRIGQTLSRLQGLAKRGYERGTAKIEQLSGSRGDAVTWVVDEVVPTARSEVQTTVRWCQSLDEFFPFHQQLEREQDHGTAFVTVCDRAGAATYGFGEAVPFLAASTSVPYRVGEVPADVLVIDRREAVLATPDSSTTVVRSKDTAFVEAALGYMDAVRDASKPAPGLVEVPEGLGPRQHVVASMLAAGHQVDGVADKLGLSRRTVTKDLKQLRRVIGGATQVAFGAAYCRFALRASSVVG